jgi:hypothetical protein
VESDFSIVLLRTSEVDLMMCTVDVTSPEDSMSLSTKSIHILREFTVKDDLPLPGIFGFPSIGEIYPEEIEDISIVYAFDSEFLSFRVLREILLRIGQDVSYVDMTGALWSQFHMRYPSLICCRVTRKRVEKSDVKILIHSLMDPRSCSRISWLFCRIVVSSIMHRIFEVFGDFIMSCLDLLHEEDIWIMSFEKVHEFSFIMSGADAVYVPGDDTHRWIIYIV